MPGQVSSARQVIDICICLVADDKALLAVEHRQPAAHMVERGLEAGVELLELFVTLDECAELLLQCRLQVRNLFAREGLRCLLATRGVWPPRSEGKLERALGHVWPSLTVAAAFSNSRGDDGLYIPNQMLLNGSNSLASKHSNFRSSAQSFQPQ